MAIGFPRDLPNRRVEFVRFEAEPLSGSTPEGAGKRLSALIARPVWRLEVRARPRNEEDFSEWRAWLDSLEGGAQQFRGYDIRRPAPWNYRRPVDPPLQRAGGGIFNGDASFSLNADRDVATLGSTLALPQGYNLIEGDYVRFEYSGGGSQRHSLHRILEDRAANSSGVQSWTIWPSAPPAPAGASSSKAWVGVAVADALAPLGFQIVQRPFCLMRVTNRDRSAEGKLRTIAFEAIEDLDISALPPPPPPPPP